MFITLLMVTFLIALGTSLFAYGSFASPSAAS
jgi:hypothetical protein